MKKEIEMKKKPTEYRLFAIMGAPMLITGGNERAFVVFEINPGRALPPERQIQEELGTGELKFTVPSEDGIVGVAIGPDDYDLFKHVDEAYLKEEGRAAEIVRDEDEDVPTISQHNRPAGKKPPTGH